MYSFYPRTVHEWNYLAQDVVQLGTPEAFRSAIVFRNWTRALHCYMQ